MKAHMKIDRCISVLSRAALAGLFLGVAGCVVHEHHEGYTRVERTPVVRSEVAVTPSVPAAETAIDAEDVYEPAPAEAVATYETDLSPYGSWVVTAQYGRCWVPRARPAGWRPYTVGHWVNTSDGWCWTAEGAEADWGIVTYHYGRWYEDPRAGWCWVPGTTWAPAWVAWRDGGGYSGWAPLPPRVGYRQQIDAVYVERAIPADRYVYVEQRYLAEPHVREHVVVNNVTIIKKTTNITNITYVNNRVVNRGVSVTEVERSSGRHYETVKTTEVTSASEARRLRSEGKPVAYEPAAVKKADVEYRERVTRRVEEQKAERARVERRATDANVAEHDRGSAREKEAAAAKAAEHDRVVAREKEAGAADKAEHDRALAREKDKAAADKAEHDRALAREKDKAAADKAEHDRAAARAKDAAAAEHDRAVAREKDAAAAKTAEKTRVERRTADQAAEDKAEHDRALRREKDAAAAKEKEAKTSKTTSSKDAKNDAAAKAKAEEDAKAAEHERALRRAKEEADAKAKAASGGK